MDCQISRAYRMHRIEMTFAAALYVYAGKYEGNFEPFVRLPKGHCEIYFTLHTRKQHNTEKFPVKALAFFISIKNFKAYKHEVVSFIRTFSARNTDSGHCVFDLLKGII